MTRLLLNPASGGGRGFELAAWLRGRRGLDVRLPRDGREMQEQARGAAAEGLCRLLVVGGDGALHHAIQGLAGSACALGIVPAGSGNDLARALGLPLDPQAALERVLAGRPRRIDLGRVAGRVFAGVAGLGFDATVARRVAARRRRVRGRWVYLVELLRTLPTYRAPTLAIGCGTGAFHGPAMLAAVANAPCYGGGMFIAPGAAMDDGWLDLVIVERVSPLALLALVPRVYRGLDAPHRAIRRSRVRRVTIRSEEPLEVYGDGERLATTSAAGTEIEVWPGALGVLH